MAFCLGLELGLVRSGHPVNKCVEDESEQRLLRVVAREVRLLRSLSFSKVQGDNVNPALCTLKRRP